MSDVQPDRSDWTWYHSTLGTYGSWLPGDPRGFRTRHHREHVEGDYKNRPEAGQYEGLHERCRSSLKQAPVAISPTFRQLAGIALLNRLKGLGSQVVAVSVSVEHLHVLAKMPTGSPREWLGMAKRHVWFELREKGWEGKLWGKRGRNEPVHDREHQLRIYHYIVRHEQSGAWVWKWGDDKPNP